MEELLEDFSSLLTPPLAYGNFLKQYIMYHTPR